MTGRATASADFVKRLEEETGCVLLPLKPGNKPGAAVGTIDLTEDMFK
mgnify:CR=1 FL=1